MAVFFDEKLEINEDFKQLAYELIEAVYSKEKNPAVKRNAGKRKIKSKTWMSEVIFANLLKYRGQEIIVPFYHSSASNNKAYKKALSFLQHIGFIDIYIALNNEEFSRLPIWERSKHLIAGGKRRKSSIILTEKGRKKISTVCPGPEQTMLFDTCIKLQGKTREKDTLPYVITSEQKQELLPRFNELLAYREQVAGYNVTYFDSRHGVWIPLNDLPYMVFNFREGHNFDRGGRITYCANRINSEYRPSILINGLPTVELDYKCSLPSILLQRAGVTKDDYYSFKGYPEAYRPMFKKITVCILGSRKENSVKRAMIDKLNRQWYLMEQGEKFEEFWISGKNKNEVLADIKSCCEIAIKAYKSIPALEGKLFRGEDQISLELQYIESLIAWEIINEFVELQKLIFCIHDSFVVLEQDMERLHTSMIRAYRKHVGRNPLPIDLPSITSTAIH